VSLPRRAYDPANLLTGASHAIERARSRGADRIEPDDLLAGLLLAVSRFGIVDLGPVAIDLEPLALQFDLPVPEPSLKPAYAPEAAAVFERAARIARGDGARSLAPIHLLVALGDPEIPIFARIADLYRLDSASWRRMLAGIEPAGSRTPAEAAEQAGEQQGSDAGLPAGIGKPAAEDLLSPEEAAGLLGLHIQTLRGYIRSGRLPAFRVAGQRAIRLKRDDVLGLLERLDARSALPQDSG
jgi:excisionase family DNA binding protein